MDKFEMMRRIRIRSWKDVVALVAGIAVYTLISFGMPRVFPNISEKATNIIAGIATFIVVLILLFGLNA